MNLPEKRKNNKSFNSLKVLLNEKYNSFIVDDIVAFASRWIISLPQWWIRNKKIIFYDIETRIKVFDWCL